MLMLFNEEEETKQKNSLPNFLWSLIDLIFSFFWLFKNSIIVFCYFDIFCFLNDDDNDNKIKNKIKNFKIEKIFSIN